jgi:hypothetical protein
MKVTNFAISLSVADNVPLVPVLTDFAAGYPA